MSCVEYHKEVVRVLLRAVQLKSHRRPRGTQRSSNNQHPSRRVEAAVKSLKKGNSAGVDNVPAELVLTGEKQ